MATRSLATLSLSFGLVSIPVKLYSATESEAAIRFKLMSRGGARLRQQYVADDEMAPVEAPAMAPAPPRLARARHPRRRPRSPSRRTTTSLPRPSRRPNPPS